MRGRLIAFTALLSPWLIRASGTGTNQEFVVR
ncbi:hypothetical protein ABH926_007370 [Catenulispora sp. GP43]